MRYKYSKYRPEDLEGVDLEDLLSRLHSEHSPQAGSHESTTCVPGTSETPGPTASTTPAPSWPSTAGQGV